MINVTSRRVAVTMQSRWIRVLLVAEAIVAVAAAAFVVPGAASNPFLVAGAAIGALILLNGGATAGIYAVLRVYCRRWSNGPRAGVLSSSCTAFKECLALLATFTLFVPFERWWMGGDAVGPLAPGRLPILLVHGYLCNRGLWWWLRRGLRAQSLAVATLNLEPPFGGLDHFAAQLRQRVDSLVEETGAGRVVIVTHSMGALVARAYLQRHGSARVAKLVTVAAPHRGTLVARLGPGRNAREMEPDSAWLRRLNAWQAPPIPVAAIWSRGDEFIVPHDSGRLPGAREHILPALGHVAMAFSPAVLRILKDELTPCRP